MSLSSLPRVPVVAGWPVPAQAVVRYFVTAVCAGSAGVHAALVGPHLAEGGPPLGAAFAAAAAGLAAAALTVRQPRHDWWAPAAAAAVLCVIAVAYLLSRSIGVPLLINETEQLDPLGAGTTVAELAGAICSVALISRKDKI